MSSKPAAAPARAAAAALTRRGADVVLTVRLTPRAAADQLDGPATRADGTTVLAARVRAAPVDGAANTALTALIAGRLGVAKAAVEVTGGASSRAKRVTVRGLAARTDAELEAALSGRGRSQHRKPRETTT